MKIGLFGFGKAGRAVASVLRQDKKINLCWGSYENQRLNNRNPYRIYSISNPAQQAYFSAKTTDRRPGS